MALIGDGEANLWRDNLSGRLTPAGAARIKLYNDAATPVLVYNQPIGAKTIYNRRLELTQTLGSGDANGHNLLFLELWDNNSGWIGTWWFSPPIDRRTGAPEAGTVVNITTVIDF